MFDVIVIGGGVTGCSILRELSKYDLKVALLEKEEDVCSGTSKANSAIVHAGHDAKSDSLKAKLNVRGNELIKELAKDLNFAYKNNGSLVLCFDEEDYPKLEELYNRGITNGVKDLHILKSDEVLKLEPNLSDNVKYALLANTGAIICPFEMNVALAENAVQNGAEVILNTEVKEIKKINDHYLINNQYETRCVVNAAGLYGDVIHNMICEKKRTITARKGDYCLYDTDLGDLVSHTIFQLPTAKGKGVLVTPTVHGNLLVGPSATDIDDKEDTGTYASDLDFVLTNALKSVKSLPNNKIITSFSGLRAKGDTGDFIIEEANDNFFDAIGIESPGLTSAPAIGEMVSEMVVEKLKPSLKDNFISTRKGLVHLKHLSYKQRGELIKQNPLYGNIICRCNDVSEGEIIDAINSPIKATSLDAIKRRTTAGMGRCQAGFCCPKTIEILARELGVKEEEITKNNAKSRMILGKLGEDDEL